MTSCLILAAGEGTRLRPLTNDCPKGLVSLLGKSIVSHQIGNLRSLNILDIGIVTGYRAEKFNNLGCQTFNNIFFKTTNMVESLFAARLFLEEAKDDVLISYGDIVYEKSNLKTVLSTNSDVVVMVDDGWKDLWSLRNENPLNDAETLKYGSKGQIIELGKKPKSLLDIDGQYTGLIKISHNKIKDFISFYDQLNRSILYEGRQFKQMYMTSFLQLLIDAGWMVMPARVRHGWLEVDTVEDIKLYERLSKEGKLGHLWKINE
jgi:L-glutamine-phosphate cytidylyltransferase